MNKIIVNNTEVSNIKDITIKVDPLWGDGTGRDTMDGHYSGTFIGYFTTMQIDFERTTNAEFNIIKTLLEHPFLEGVQFTLEKDMKTYSQGDLYTEDFYNGTAIEAKPNKYHTGYEEFSITLIAVDRRVQTS